MLIYIQGKYKLVWYLRDFLCRLPQSLSRGCGLDWQRTSLPCVLHWYIFRSSYRRGILSPSFLLAILLYSLTRMSPPRTEERSFIAVFGTILTLLGMFMASLSTQYWQLFLAQGICVGLGAGCLFCPALAIVSTYFSSRKMLAIGICACGSATGGLVYPAMFQQLIPQLGYGWTMRALGFTTMACLVVCNILARPRLPPHTTGPMVELAAFKETSYSLFAIGIFLVFWGVYFAFYFVSSIGVEIIGIPQNESFNLFLVLNGVGIIGRTLPAYLADKYTGPLNILLMVTAMSIVCAWAMIGVTTRGGLYAWSVVYGIVGNALQAMFPATLSSLTTDLKKSGVRMGMIFVSAQSCSASCRD